MQIRKLEIQRLKGIKLVEIHDPGDVVEIAGPNGAGKSSVLDAILYAIAGKKGHCAKPVREGEETAEVVIETETLKITRRWTKGGESSTVTVRSLDGGKHGQERLDRLFDKFTFDPLAFSRMRPADQIAELQRLAGPEFRATMDEIAKTEADAAVDRAALSQSIKRLGELPAAPPEVQRVEAQEVIDQLERATAHNAAQERVRMMAQQLAQDRSGIMRRLEEARGRLRDLQAMVQRQETEIAEIAAKDLALERAIAEAPQPGPPLDVSVLKRDLASIERQNREAEAWSDWCHLQAEHQRLRTEHARCEASIKEARSKRLAAFAGAKLPVDGVMWGDTGIEVNGTPFEQLSSSERIRISAAMGMAGDPELRIMFVRDGSLLDKPSFDQLTAQAIERKYQLWIETVGDGHGDAIVLQEGERAIPKPAA